MSPVLKSQKQANLYVYIYFRTKQRIEGHRKCHQHDRKHQAELHERYADIPEHDNVDPKHRQTTDKNHQVQPTQEDKHTHAVPQILLDKDKDQYL